MSLKMLLRDNLNILDLLIKEKTTIKDIIYAPIIENKIQPLVVDVGARNGMQEGLIPDSYASFSKLIGFEPNEIEYKKLVEGNTDAENLGIKMSKFKDNEYFNCALWNKDELRTLYLTNGPGAVTLMGDSERHITEKMYLNGDVKNNYYERHVKVLDQTKISCKRLDSLLDNSQVIDILKIDVEGAELKVMEGCEGFFNNKNILLIKNEFLITPYFKEKNLLGHQQIFLDDRGYRLIDFDFNQKRYIRSTNLVNSLSDRRPIYAGDAYFILDPDVNELDPICRHRIGLACFIKKFYSLGLDLMREANLVDKQDLYKIQQKISNHWTRAKLKQGFFNASVKLSQLLKI